MEEIRAYLMGSDGHIAHRIDLVCADEKEARERAQQLVDGHAVELWHLDRMVERFEPSQ